jgi:hypothetical protein
LSSATPELRGNAVFHLFSFEPLSCFALFLICQAAFCCHTFEFSRRQSIGRKHNKWRKSFVARISRLW